MPWPGDETFRRTTGTNSGSVAWEATRNAGRRIRVDDHDTHDEDLANGLENCLTRDGQMSPKQRIDWNGQPLSGLADGAGASHAANKGQLDALRLPAGFMGDFGGAVAPSVWLLCDGSAVLRVTYADLFAAIGTTWGGRRLAHFQRAGLSAAGGSGLGRLPQQRPVVRHLAQDHQDVGTSTNIHAFIVMFALESTSRISTRWKCPRPQVTNR